MTEWLGKSKPFGWKEVWCLLCIFSRVEHESFKDVSWSIIWKMWLCSPLDSNSHYKQSPSVPSQAWCVDKQKQQTAHRHLPGQNSRGSLSTKVESEYLLAFYLCKLPPPTALISCSRRVAASLCGWGRDCLWLKPVKGSLFLKLKIGVNKSRSGLLAVEHISWC